MLGREAFALGATIVALGVGEELWQSFLPAYIIALGASPAIVGLFGSSRDLLDAAYQLPGGWVSDRFGSRRAIAAFTLTATLGYVVYAAASSWPLVFAGLAFAMTWKAGAFPATFSLIGELLPGGRRVGGFTLQSFAVRIPRVVAAPIGGLLVWRFGILAGIRLGLAIAIVFAMVALFTQWKAFTWAPAVRRHESAARGAVLSHPLRRLLGAECLVRMGEAVAATFVVLYVTIVRDVPLPLFGGLYAVQQAVAVALYVPSTRLASLIGTRALILATFAFFALFPLALLWAPGRGGLLFAFILGGFKEIGEPARKASIVDLCRPESRAREVGAYYTIRNLLVVPGSFVGGLLWQRSPALVFAVAGAVAAAGFLFAVATRSAWADPTLDDARFEARDGAR